MPQERIPFIPDQQSGGAALAGASPVAMNVVLDSAGAVRRRPCITTHSEAPTTAIDASITGLYVTAADDILAVGAFSPFAKVYRVLGGSALDLSPSSASLINGGRRPTFAETEAIVAIAAGNRISKVVLDGFTVSALGGGPPKASHVIANASRLLANTVDPTENLNFVFYSGFAAGSSYSGHEDWTGFESGTFSGDARPDPVVALHENLAEVAAVGTSNVQLFSPDGTLDYAPTLTQEHGCIAPYSVIRVGKGYAWLDHARRFVVTDGRSIQPVSGPIQQTLADMSTVDDCFGYRVQLGAVDAMVWTFPTDGRTFVFAGGWSQWSGYSAGVPTTYPVTAHAIRLGENLVGTSGGKIGKLSASAVTDLGESVPCYIETGYVDRGTSAAKHCKSIRLTLERGSSGEGEILISYRDDTGPWSGPLTVEMGPDRDPVVTIRSLGTYRKRQWRFSFSGSEALNLVSVIEDYAVLGV